MAPPCAINDRSGNRQAQAHAGLFSRKEAGEQTRQMLRVDARAAVFGVDRLHGQGQADDAGIPRQAVHQS